MSNKLEIRRQSAASHQSRTNEAKKTARMRVTASMRISRVAALKGSPADWDEDAEAVAEAVPTDGLPLLELC